MKKQLLLIVLLALIGLNVNAQTQLITNGNFSSSSGWITSGNWYITTTKTCYNNSSGYAYAGDANGYAIINETGDLKQTVTIPSTATSATLTFYASKSTDEVTTSEIFDYVNVFLFNSSGSQLMQFSSTNINNLYAGKPATLCDGYSFKSFSIPTTYFGQPVQVVFRVHSDGAKNTMFRIDDVSLTYIAGASCTSPTSSVNSPTGSSPLTITCTASGSGGTIAYKWYSGSSCSGTVLGTSSTLNVTTSGYYSCKAYINGYESTCYNCASGYATISIACTSPSSSVNSPTGSSPLTMTCTASGSGGTIAYKWYSGSSCSGTVLGTSSTLNVTTSGYYACKAYINGYESTCYNCASGYATISSSCTSPSSSVNSPTGSSPLTMTCTASGSGGTLAYKWYSGTACSGTVLGTNSTLSVSTSGYYTCKAYIIGNESTCYNCVSGNATINSASGPVEGIDIHNNTITSWSDVVGDGIQFAYIKATESTYTPYTNFPVKALGAIGQNIVVGAYHFATPLFSSGYYQSSYDHQNTVSQEATNFVNAAYITHKYIGAGFLPPALDVEDQIVSFTPSNGLSYNVFVDPLSGNSHYSDSNGEHTLPAQKAMGAAALAQWIHDWTTQVELQTHIMPVIYCTRYYAQQLYPYFLNGTITSKLWIADTTIGSEGSPNTTGWTNWPWIFQQYSWKGTINGITGDVLLDVFKGDLASFNSLIEGTPIAPPPNDNPCDAGVPTLSVGTSCTLLPGSNVGATNSSVPNLSCDGTTCDGDVWYKFIVPASGHVIINTKDGTLNDMGMALYTGSNCNSLTYYNCYKNGSSYSQYMPYADVTGLTPNATMWVRLWDYLSNDVGTFSICATDGGGGGCSQPSNDNCSGNFSAFPLTFGSTCNPVTKTSCGATSSGFSSCTGNQDDDVFFSFVPTSTSATITVQSLDDFDAVFQVLNGPCGSSMTEVTNGCVDNTAEGGIETTTVSGLVNGSTYFIRVWHYYSGYGTNGNFTICVTGTAVTSPTITASQTSLPDFGSLQVSANSSPQNFTVSGSSLTANITLSAPSGFQISTSSSSGFGNTLTLTQSGGTVSSTPIYVRFSPSVTGTQSENISLTSTGATTKYVSVSGTGTSAPSPTITASTTSLQDFGSVQVGANSSPQNFTVSGSSLTANITLSAPSGFQISTNSSSGFGSSLTLTQSGGTVSSTPIYIRFSPSSTGIQSGSISLTSTGATTKNVSVSGTGTAAPSPTITASISSLQDFGNVQVGTNSSPQNYTVSGSSLTANITISAPSGFQISTSSSSGFVNSVTLTQSDGTVSSTPIYVRFSPSSTGTQSGSISLTSTGATTKYVSVSGTGTAAPSPTITASQTSLSDFGSVQVGTNSTPQNYTVSGSSLTANITISAPSGFQISTSSSSSFGGTVTLTQSGGTVSSTPIYVRFSPSSTGILSGSISLTSTGATTKYVSVSGTGTATGTSSYCSAGSSSADEYISNVTLGSINQTSDIGTAGYQDFTSQNTTLQIGGNASVTITLGVGYTSDQILIWVDWNKDGDFTDTGENVYGTVGSLLYMTSTANFTVPAGATIGTTRLRIRLHDTANGPNATPCGDADYGEVEDYSINVIQEACNLSVLPTSLSFTASAESKTVAITSNSTWTVSDDASWISVSPLSGSGNSNLTVSVTPNTGTLKNGTITISGCNLNRLITVNQEPENICQPNWTLVSYTNNTTAYCKVTIKGIPATSNDKLGAFVGDECRGIGNIIINNNEAYATIIIQGISQETVTFKIWDAGECAELVTCSSFTTNPGGNIGNPPNYLVVDVCTDRTQSLNLTNGWNLASLYINTETKSPKELFVGSTCITQVKNMTKSWDPTVPDFLNTLQVLSKGEGYFIKTQNACNIEITGPYIGKDHSINLTSGWNLIGYPYDICQEGKTGLKVLLDNSKVIQLKNMTQSYDPLVPDFLNTLKYLTPGEGYFLKVNGNYNNFITPEPTVCLKSAALKLKSVCDWQFIGYEKSTIAYGEITLNNLPVLGDAYIGAFIGNECRSVMPLIQNDGRSYASMVINGDEKEQITFRLCYGGNVYESKTTILSNPGESTQSIIPIPFNSIVQISQDPELSASPNPFSRNLEINIRIFSNDDITINIYNTESKLVKSFKVDNASPGIYKFDWEAKDFSGNTCATGMYFIQFYGKTGSDVQKVILDR